MRETERIGSSHGGRRSITELDNIRDTVLDSTVCPNESPTRIRISLPFPLTVLKQNARVK